MNILVTLNSGLGADLGPNFNLTANVGSVTPSTATKSQLTTGIFVDVDASATQITVTSTGTCTTSIVLNISGQTTSTTTLGISSFVLGRDTLNFFTACTEYTANPITYYSGAGAILQVGTTLYFENTLTNKVVAGYYSNGTNWYLCNSFGAITSTGSCSTTSTTSTSTTSTSTTSTSTTSTSTSTTSTTLPPETFSLGYSATTDWQACFASQTNYYAYTGELLQNGLILYTDITLSTKAPSGWYSNGSNYWFIAAACREYTFTNNLGYDESVSYYDCTGVLQILLVYDGTTSSAVCVDVITNLNGLTANDNGAGSCPPSTTGVLQDEAVCPTTTTTSTTSTSTSTTSTSTSTTSTSTSTTSTSTTTAAPTTTTTTSGGGTTSTTTLSYTPFSLTYSNTAGETACTDYVLPTNRNVYYAGPGATLGTGTVLYTTSALTTTVANGYYSNGANYWNTAANAGNLQNQTVCAGATSSTTSTTTTTTQPPTTTTSTSTSTSTSSTTTAAPSTVDIYITNTSLDVPIGSMTINGVNVTWVGYGPNFVLSSGENGSFTSNQFGTYDVVIGYGGHIPGQKITFTDSASNITCQNLNGSIGTFTITGATITAGTTITVSAEDGSC